MPEDPLEQRVAAVERALADDEAPAPTESTDCDDVDDRLVTLEEDVAELEAAVQAVRGYVGGVKHVNDEVEQRADAALAKAEAVERTLAVTRPGADPDARNGSGSANVSDRRADGADRRGGRRSGPGAPGQAGRTGHEPDRGAVGGGAGPDDVGGSGDAPVADAAVADAAPHDGPDPRPDEQSTATREGCPRCGSRSAPEHRSPDRTTPTDGAVPGGRLPEADRPPEGLGEDALEDPDDEPSGGVFARLRQVL